MFPTHDGPLQLAMPSAGHRTLSETLVAASALSLSPILLPVRWDPSRPASGESFGENTILRHAKLNAG
jgi:hypothetical protein